MPRETDCGCCEAQRAFVVCYECGKGDKKSVPLCKDCSSFIHRGLLSGHQVSSISRHTDREYQERRSPSQSKVKADSKETQSGYYDSRSSNSKPRSSYSDRNESRTASQSHTSSKYTSSRHESRSGSQTRSNYADRNDDRSTNQNDANTSFVEGNDMSCTYVDMPDTVEDVITYPEAELAANGFGSTDFLQQEFPDSQRPDYDQGSRGYSSERERDRSDRDESRDAVVSSSYPHQPMSSSDRTRSGVYSLLPKVRYMDDEIFLVIVNSSLHPDGTFWAAMVRTTEEEEDFKRFEDDLRYSASSASPCDHLDHGTEVLANVKSTWCRAKIEHNIDSSTYKVRQTDCGSSARVHQSCLKNLPLKFYTVPYQALRCCIASKEVEKFDGESQDLFQSMTEKRTLTAQVIQCDTQNKTFYVKLLFSSGENDVDHINISERVLQKAAVGLGRALHITKAPDLRVTKYFSSETNKDVVEVKVSGDPLDAGSRKRPMVMIAQRPKVLKGAVMPKTDEHGQPRCFHCNHYGHFAKFCPRKTCRGWKRKK